MTSDAMRLLPPRQLGAHGRQLGLRRSNGLRAREGRPQRRPAELLHGAPHVLLRREPLLSRFTLPRQAV